MARGTINAPRTSITACVFAENWSLDPTGNWQNYCQSADGATWDLIQSRTANPVNEMTDITNTAGPAWAQPAYDAAGNMTTIPRGPQGGPSWSGLTTPEWSNLTPEEWSTLPLDATTAAADGAFTAGWPSQLL